MERGKKESITMKRKNHTTVCVDQAKEMLPFEERWRLPGETPRMSKKTNFSSRYTCGILIQSVPNRLEEEEGTR